MDGRNRLPPGMPHSISLISSQKLAADSVSRITSIDSAQNIVVIKTMPGLASAAASAVDAMNMSVVVGTLAGDDTVFLVMRDNNAAAAFCGEIKNLLA